MTTQDILHRMRRHASALGECGLLAHTPDDIHELAGLLFTPQGIEFATAHAFPALGDLRALSEHCTLAPVLYVDAGSVSGNNSHIVVAGATSASLRYDDPRRVHKVVLAHGAYVRAEVEAYCVLVIDAIGRGCSATIEADSSATIIYDHGQAIEIVRI